MIFSCHGLRIPFAANFNILFFVVSTFGYYSLKFMLGNAKKFDCQKCFNVSVALVGLVWANDWRDEIILKCN